MKRICALGALAVALIAGRAGAATIVYSSLLDGPSEPTASPGTGSTTVTYDSTAHTLHVVFNFTGLQGTTTAAHIHAATALPFTGSTGVATTMPYFPGFVTGVTSGSYDNTLDLTSDGSWSPGYKSANGGTNSSAEAALAAALAAGKAYLNIHSSMYGGGEIRGFLKPVPEPASIALAGVALVGFAARRRHS